MNERCHSTENDWSGTHSNNNIICIFSRKLIYFRSTSRPTKRDTRIEIKVKIRAFTLQSLNSVNYSIVLPPNMRLLYLVQTLPSLWWQIQSSWWSPLGSATRNVSPFWSHQLSTVLKSSFTRSPSPSKPNQNCWSFFLWYVEKSIYFHRMPDTDQN